MRAHELRQRIDTQLGGKWDSGPHTPAGSNQKSCAWRSHNASVPASRPPSPLLRLHCTHPNTPAQHMNPTVSVVIVTADCNSQNHHRHVRGHVVLSVRCECPAELGQTQLDASQCPHFVPRFVISPLVTSGRVYNPAPSVGGSRVQNKKKRCSCSPRLGGSLYCAFLLWGLGVN